MTSEKKTQANRQNALKSTGPKTPEGKDAVRLNAMMHGLLCQEVLLPGEDEEALRELSEHLWTELKPVGEMKKPPRRPNHRLPLEASSAGSGRGGHIRLGALRGTGRAGGA